MRTISFVLIILTITAGFGVCENPGAQVNGDPRVPRQVWLSDEILCPLDPSKDWGKQLPYPPEVSSPDPLSEPKLVSHWDLPTTDLMDPKHRQPIVLEAIVNTRGKVERIGVLEGYGLAYTDALVETMKGIEFKPATWNDQPICFAYVFVARPHPR